jgi:hypothetical protein
MIWGLTLTATPMLSVDGETRCTTGRVASAPRVMNPGTCTKSVASVPPMTSRTPDE